MATGAVSASPLLKAPSAGRVAWRSMEAPDDHPSMDIGVTPTHSKTRAAGRSRPLVGDRRKLPPWALATAALLVGWILGSVLSPGQSNRVAEKFEQERADLERLAELGVEELEAEAPEPAPEQSSQANLGAEDRLTVVIVQAPLRGVAIPAELTVIDEQGVPTPIDVDREVAGATQRVVGQADQRLLVVEESVAFMAVDEVMIFDPKAKSEPEKVAEAIYLMAGSDPGHTWAVTSGSDSVLDIDVRARELRAEYDLTDVGQPVGSFNGGLVVVPVNRRLGDFALWSPRRGVEKLWDLWDQWELNDRATFLDASGNVIVVHTPQGLASYNVVTGSLTQTDRQLETRLQHRAFVSPDGALLAVVQRGSVTELPSVVIIDLATGSEVDRFATAYEWHLQWVSGNEVLFVLGPPADTRVMIRNVEQSESEVIASIDGARYWVTTLQS